MHAPKLNRRQFSAGLSAGLGAIVVAFTLRPEGALAQAAPLPGSQLSTSRDDARRWPANGRGRVDRGPPTSAARRSCV